MPLWSLSTHEPVIPEKGTHENEIWAVKTVGVQERWPPFVQCPGDLSVINKLNYSLVSHVLDFYYVLDSVVKTYEATKMTQTKLTVI